MPRSSLVQIGDIVIVVDDEHRFSQFSDELAFALP
jgi:hypothetical protein